MSHYRIEDEFQISRTRYWEMFFDPDYNAALFEHLDIDCDPIELRREGEGDDEEILRVQQLTPRRELPSALKRIAKTAISYEERNHFRRSENRIKVVTTPSFMADKLSIRGDYFIEDRGENKVVRIWDAICECRVPFIGKKIESYLIDEIRNSYASTTEFTHRWIREHPKIAPDTA